MVLAHMGPTRPAEPSGERSPCWTTPPRLIWEEESWFNLNSSPSRFGERAKGLAGPPYMAEGEGGQETLVNHPTAIAATTTATDAPSSLSLPWSATRPLPSFRSNLDRDRRSAAGSSSTQSVKSVCLITRSTQWCFSRTFGYHEGVARVTLDHGSQRIIHLLTIN
jgi:hypothetical protein